MKKLYVIFCILIISAIGDICFAEDLIHKESCLSLLNREDTYIVKEELLSDAKKMALNAIFGELITSFSKIENSFLTERTIRTYSSGFIRIKGNPEYKNGKNLGEICVTIKAFATEQDKKTFEPVIIKNKECISDDNRTIKELIDLVKQKVILTSIINYEKKLENRDANSLLPLVHKVNYPQSGFVPNTTTYCVMMEGTIYPIEILSLINFTIEKYVSVLGKKSWIDTELDILTGQQVVIRAEGEVFANNSLSAGPNGLLNGQKRSYNIFNGANHIALIGRIGKTNVPFSIGEYNSFVAEKAGRLFLRVNDNDYQNNKGAFKTKITIQ